MENTDFEKAELGLRMVCELLEEEEKHTKEYEDEIDYFFALDGYYDED